MSNASISLIITRIKITSKDSLEGREKSLYHIYVVWSTEICWLYAQVNNLIQYLIQTSNKSKNYNNYGTFTRSTSVSSCMCFGNLHVHHCNWYCDCRLHQHGNFPCNFHWNYCWYLVWHVCKDKHVLHFTWDVSLEKQPCINRLILKSTFNFCFLN